jgi:26S proteasome regulatory subunit T4
VVGCRRQLDKAKLKPGTRVALDMTTLTIMRYLPREVDPLVYNMSHEDPGDVSYSAIGGLGEQIRELREVIELPLLNPGKHSSAKCHHLLSVSFNSQSNAIHSN